MPVSPDVAEALSNFLFELGCSGVQESEVELVAYFPAEASKQKLLAEIEKYRAGLKALGYLSSEEAATILSCENRDWNAEWKKQLRPLSVSRRFLVKPTWVALDEPVEQFVIEIDPKQAFGTGAHATTQLVLRLLEELPVKDKRILDVGTGTGILAIAGHKLGAGKITACDIDPVAIEAARENTEANTGEGAVQLFVGSGVALSRQARFDFVLANITKNVIFACLADIVAPLVQGGYLLASGILGTEVDEVKDRLATTDLAVMNEEHLGEWAALHLQKQMPA